MARDNSVSFVSAFALGGLAGAAIALLYAPRSGAETRRLLGERARRSAEAGRDRLREGAEYAREKVGQGAEYGRQMAHRMMGKGEEVLQKAEAAADSMAEDVSAFVDRRRKPRTTVPDTPQV
jgi:gas vesicle protein